MRAMGRWGFMLALIPFVMGCVSRRFGEGAGVADRTPAPQPEERCDAGDLPATLFLHALAQLPPLPPWVQSDNGPVKPVPPNGRNSFLQLNFCVSSDGARVRLMRLFFWGAGFRGLEIPGEQIELLKGNLGGLVFNAGGEFLARAKASTQVPNNEYSIYLMGLQGGFAVGAVYGDRGDGVVRVTEGEIIVGRLDPSLPGVAQESPCAGAARLARRQFRVADAEISVEFCKNRDSYGITQVEVSDRSSELPRELQGRRFSIAGSAVRLVGGRLSESEARLFGAEPRVYFTSHHHFSCDALWISLPHASYGLTTASVVGGYGEECQPGLPHVPERGVRSGSDLFFDLKYPRRTVEGKLRCSHFLDSCD